MSRLKQIREQKHLTQEELSEESGISVRTIQRIESGTKPKGHTLKILSKTLDIQESELLDEDKKSEDETIIEDKGYIPEDEIPADFSTIKLINLSSVLFVVIPPLNILAPILLTSYFRQKNKITKQIVSVQIIWTILAPIIFMLGIFLKLGNRFTLLIMILIVLSNIFIIIRNAMEIDRNKKLRYKLNFNII